MKKAVLIMNLLLIFCCLSAAEKTKKISVKDFTYYNKDIGIAIILPSDWENYTSKKNAHPSFKSIFEDKKRPNDSPLFVGMEKNQQSFVRCLVEKLDYDLNNYFKLLYDVLTAEKVKFIDAVIIEDKETVACTFLLEKGGINFIYKEFITKSKGCFIRLSFGTIRAYYDAKLPVFNSIKENIYFLNKNNKWEAKLLDINENSAKKIDFVTIYQDEPEFTNKFGPDDKAVFHTVKGSKNRIYILGSIHLGHPDFYPMPENIIKAYLDTKNIVFEINTDKPENKEKIDNLAKLGTLEDNKTLDMVIPKYLYDKLVEELRKLGLNIDIVKTYKPWLVSIVLSVLPGMTLGYSEEFGIDRHFLNKAQADKKNILELENLDDQIDLIVNKLDQETNLGMSLLTLETSKVYYKELVRSWKKGDEQTLERLIFSKSPLFKTEDYYDKFFYERNTKMAEKIITYLNDETDYFIIVGAGHLIGDKSIIAILKAKGFITD